MKKIFTFLILTILFLVLPIKSNALEQDVNLYLFYSETCSHCHEERQWLETIKEDYSYLNIYEYEVTRNSDNNQLLEDVKKRLNSTSQYVPFTVVGDKYWVGFNDDVKNKVIDMIEQYHTTDHHDVVNDAINKVPYEEISVPKEETKTDEFTIPVLGTINAKNVSLPLLSIIIGAVDGFNPCAMWVLIFLISMLMGMHNKKRMWTLGLTFLITSALVYLLFMVAWLKVAVGLTSITWIRLIISLVALIGAFVNLKSFYKSVKQKDSGCEVVDSNKRKKIITKIKKFTTQKSFILAIIGVMALAFSVNLIELACSAGLPLIFTQILALNDLSTLQYMAYILIYIFFFLIDDIIVFTIAMVTFEITGISTKYTKYSHLIGGIIMFIIGFLMIFKPEWLMFNF